MKSKDYMYVECIEPTNGIFNTELLKVKEYDTAHYQIKRGSKTEICEKKCFKKITYGRYLKSKAIECLFFCPCLGFYWGNCIFGVGFTYAHNFIRVGTGLYRLRYFRFYNVNNGVTP